MVISCSFYHYLFLAPATLSPLHAFSRITLLIYFVFFCVFCVMTLIIYILAHVSAPPSPCDHYSNYILLCLILLCAIIHELVEIERIKSKSPSTGYITSRHTYV